nr:hypothetical protein [Anaerolineaceae bacterium]
LSFLETEKTDGVAICKPVPDPRRFGVAQIDKNGKIEHLVEKPSEMDNNLVLVGFYYFRDGAELISAIEEQMEKNITLKNEFYLADAINIMLQRGAHFRVVEVKTWVDAGTPEAMFDTNHFFLSQGKDNSEEAARRFGDVVIIPPVFIHESTDVRNSVIGPDVSIAANCRLDGVIVKNAIIDKNTTIQKVIFSDALIGRNVTIDGTTRQLNIGDNAIVEL